MAWNFTTDTASCHITCIFENAIPGLRSKTRGTAKGTIMHRGRFGRQARASPAFRDGYKAVRWKPSQDREMFHTM